MKRLSIIAVFALTLISTAFANKTIAPDFKGIKNFNKSFPEATEVTYKVVEKFTEVSFTWHSMQLQAFYDNDGTLFATTRKVEIKDLPLSYLMNIRKEFAGFTPTEAIEFDQTDTGLSYYVTVADAQKTYVLKIITDGTISVFKKMKN
jgi:hypothetical protein